MHLSNGTIKIPCLSQADQDLILPSCETDIFEDASSIIPHHVSSQSPYLPASKSKTFPYGYGPFAQLQSRPLVEDYLATTTSVVQPLSTATTNKPRHPDKPKIMQLGHKKLNNN